MVGHGAKLGTIVLDLDGVLYVDAQGVPGAGDALRRLQGDGYRLLFATNNATKTAAIVVRHLTERIGFTARSDAVVTSGMATARHLAGAVGRVLVLGEPALEEAIRGAGIAVVTDWREAEAVVVGLDRGLTYARLTAATLAVGSGARFVATNADRTYPTPEGLYPGGGALVAAVAAATGVEPEVCGKPHEPMRSLIRSLLAPGPVWVVGDRLESDLAMGVGEGWKTVLVLSGVDSEQDVARSGIVPDLVLGSVADLPGALRG
jgi:4-nitrophenyl phosphatase